MEGPSIVIAREELRAFFKKTIKKASGTAKLNFSHLNGSSLTDARSWGKHLLLSFGNLHLRIHFLMFGSYRIDNPRENRIPKMHLVYQDRQIYFYSCAIKEITSSALKKYDWSVDLMSKKWNPKKAVEKLKNKPQSQICDLLMDQTIFSGLGNIMKNEILFRLRMHPETKIDELKIKRLKDIVCEAETYSWQFYEWKKANVLKRNWQIMRKKKCPNCGRKVIKKATGRLKRISHFCKNCQKKN